MAPGAERGKDEATPFGVLFSDSPLALWPGPVRMVF